MASIFFILYTEFERTKKDGLTKDKYIIIPKANESERMTERKGEKSS